MLSQNLAQGVRPVVRARCSSFSQAPLPTIHQRKASFTGRRSSISRLLNDDGTTSLDSSSPFDLSSRERRFLRRMAMLDRAFKEDPFRTLFGSSMSMLEGKGFRSPFDKATWEKWEAEGRSVLDKAFGVTKDAEAKAEVKQENFEYDPISGRMVLRMQQHQATTQEPARRASANDAINAVAKPTQRARAQSVASSVQDTLQACLSRYDLQQGRQITLQKHEDPVRKSLAESEGVVAAAITKAVESIITKKPNSKTPVDMLAFSLSEYDAKQGLFLKAQAAYVDPIHDELSRYEERNPPQVLQEQEFAPSESVAQHQDGKLEEELSRYENKNPAQVLKEQDDVVVLEPAALDAEHDPALQDELNQYKEKKTIIKEPELVTPELEAEAPSTLDDELSKYRAIKRTPAPAEEWLVTEENEGKTNFASLQSAEVDSLSAADIRARMGISKKDASKQNEEVDEWGYSLKPKGLQTSFAREVAQQTPIATAVKDESFARVDRSLAAVQESLRAAKNVLASQVASKKWTEPNFNYKPKKKLDSALNKQTAATPTKPVEVVEEVDEFGYSMKPVGMQNQFEREQAAILQGKRVSLEDEMRSMSASPAPRQRRTLEEELAAMNPTKTARRQPASREKQQQALEASRRPTMTAENVASRVVQPLRAVTNVASTLVLASKAASSHAGRVDAGIHGFLGDYEQVQGIECYKFKPDDLETELAGTPPLPLADTILPAATTSSQTSTAAVSSLPTAPSPSPQVSSLREFKYAFLNYDATVGSVQQLTTISRASRREECTLAMSDVLYRVASPEKFFEPVSNLLAVGFDITHVTPTSVTLKSSTPLPISNPTQTTNGERPFPTFDSITSSTTQADPSPYTPPSATQRVRKTEDVFSGPKVTVEQDDMHHGVQGAGPKRLGKMLKGAGKIAVSGVALAYVMGIVSELMKGR